ncbi:MAG: DnaD domain protein [Clostridia bacterium]|nr:DnaD domain protein [Clostridia bacterium]
MSYRLDMGVWNSVFAVPTVLVDKHLKLARGSEIKVILYAIRNSGKEFSLAEVAAATALSEESVEEAFDYWIQQGLISKNGNNLLPQNTEISTGKNLEAEVPEKTDTAKTEMPAAKPYQASTKFRAVRPDSLYVATRINDCEELRNLVSEIEMCLGKTITPTLLATIVNAYDDYSLPSEVIMMLISYVKNINKTSTPYIESVIHEWGMSGVNTAEAADRKIKDLDDRSVAWKKVVRIFSIDYRSPSKKEEECAYNWIKTYLMPEELIREAYERCVNNTGKMQMRYINAIIEKWHAAGIKSIEDLINAEKSEKEKEKNTSSFDLKDLDSFSYFDMKID